jgi:hypothetical protein
MKYLLKISLFTMLLAAVITACTKMDTLPFYGNETPWFVGFLNKYHTCS